ncbi:MAG TPA: SigE family RNA polymerase sigma factor [Acidothermaceae bacterium]
MLRSPASELDDEFRSLVLGSQARILRFAELLTGDRHVAEDLTQHSFAKLYASWRRLHTGNAEQYVRRCVINANTDRLRRGTWRESSRADIPERPDHFDLVASLAEHDFVMRALAELTQIERAVIALRYYNELSEAEIAGELNMPAGTVKSTAARALRKLRDVVNQARATRTDNDHAASGNDQGAAR